MRILILSQELPPDPGIGGIGTYTAMIAPALSARGHEVHVLVCRREQAPSDELVGGVRIHRRPTWTFRGIERLRRRSPEAVSRLQSATSCYLEARKIGSSFDIIETPEWMSEGLGLAVRHAMPIVTHLHTPMSVLAEYDGAAKGWDHRVADRLERALTRRSDHVTSPSRILYEHLLARGWLQPPAPTIVPHPIDIDHWHPTSIARESSPTILAVGRLEYRKAPEVLVDAAARLRNEIPGIKVVFVGASSGVRDGMPYADWVKRRAVKTSVDCRFVGWVPRQDLPAWYAGARVVAVPSRFESFSMTVVEAMAAARPVVYSSAVGAGEVVSGSIGGSEVPVDDVSALADALKPFLLNPDLAQKCGKAAADLIRRDCSPARIAELRETCYRQAIESFHTQRA